MKDAGIQGFRGFASLSVLAYHALGGLGAVGALLFGWGYAGVDLFFVLSGFVLTKRWADGAYARPDGSFDVGRYASRRIFRIVPLYYLLLPALTLGLGVPLVVPDLFFAQDYSFATWGHLVPTWTLCVEEAFYVLLPLWAPLFLDARLRPTLALAALGASLAWWSWSGVALNPAVTSSLTTTWVAHQLPAYAFDYALGSVVAALPRAGDSAAVPRYPLPTLAALLGLGVAVASAERAYVPALVGAGFALVLWGARDSRLATHRAAAWLGDLTYPLYLVGLPLTVGLATLGLAGPELALALPFGVAVAWVLHRVVEEPFVRLGRWLENRATPSESSASTRIGTSD